MKLILRGLPLPWIFLHPYVGYSDAHDLQYLQGIRTELWWSSPPFYHSVPLSSEVGQKGLRLLRIFHNEVGRGHGRGCNRLPEPAICASWLDNNANSSNPPTLLGDLPSGYYPVIPRYSRPRPPQLVATCWDKYGTITLGFMSHKHHRNVE